MTHININKIIHNEMNIMNKDEIKAIDKKQNKIDCFGDCINLKDNFLDIEEISIEERLFYNNKFDNYSESILALNNILKCKNAKYIYINTFHNDLLNSLANLENLVDIQIMKYEKIGGFICANRVCILISESGNALVTLNDDFNTDNIIKIIAEKNVKNITLLTYSGESCEKFCNNLNIECEEIKIIFNLFDSSQIKKLENLNLSNLPPLLKKIKIVFESYMYRDSEKKMEFLEQSKKSIEIIKRHIVNKVKIPHSCEILF